MPPWPIRALVCAVFTLGAIGCGRASGTDTYIRFQVEGTSYSVDDVSLFVYPPSGGRRLLLLAPSDFGPAPNARVGWRMTLESVRDLAGRQLDLKGADFWKDEGALLHLSEGVDVGQTRDSGFTLLIRTVRAGIVEGSFVGTRFELVGPSGRRRRTTDVTGQFRARVASR
ncbi:MAG: hypothetical protein P8Z36_14750 [Gemmatimonadota bacterium]|jgi:hypothetical protein